MTDYNDSTQHMTEEDIKKELKSLKKKVKQMEAQRELIRDWAHKAELLDAKKMKLRYKQILEELSKDGT
jgi:hypothetical protein